MKLTSILLLGLITACGSEQHSHFSQQDEAEQLRKKLTAEVTPFFTERSQALYFQTSDKRSIRYMYFQQNQDLGTVLILPGYTEYIEKYSEFIFDFYQKGYSVLILDHTGMGQSTRAVKNPQIVHIDKFSTYVSDVENLLEHVAPRGDLYLFAHSTGGLIGAHLVDRNPDRFTRIAYSSPLFELDLGDRNHFFAKLYLSTLNLFRSKKYAPGYSDCATEDYPFEGNLGTSSLVRWQYTRKLEQQNSSLWMCGPSVNWVLEVIRATKKQKLFDIAVKHSAPVMIYMAKEDVRIVEQSVHEFANRAPRATLRVFEDARHEIYREKEAHRRVMIDSLMQFFTTNI